MGAVRIVLQALGLLAVTALPALAQKTDVVKLVNGDTLTCEIKSLDRGRLQVSTDHLGTVNIEWDKVVAVTAKRLFRVETTTGVRLLGPLTTTTPGRVDIIEASGPVSVPAIDVVFIAPIERGFWAKLDGSLNLGLSYTQSSGIGQFNFGASAIHRRANAQWTASASSFLTVEDDGDETSRHAVDLAGVRYLKRRSLWLVQGGFMSNEELGYEVRATVSGAAGQFLVHSNRAVVAVAGGLSTSREVPVGGDSTQEIEALARLPAVVFHLRHAENRHLDEPVRLPEPHAVGPVPGRDQRSAHARNRQGFHGRLFDLQQLRQRSPDRGRAQQRPRAQPDDRVDLLERQKKRKGTTERVTILFPPFALAFLLLHLQPELVQTDRLAGIVLDLDRVLLLVERNLGGVGHAPFARPSLPKRISNSVNG